MKFEADPVAWVESTRKEPIDDDWSSVASSIVLDESFDEAALQGIEDFSHIEITFFFHRVDPTKIERGARHPRGNPEFPLTGIFAQRAKNRPNRIGHTTCRLVKREGRVLHVVDLDCIDGTPVLDIKPVYLEFLPHGARQQASWTTELMRDYWRKRVVVLLANLDWPQHADYEHLKAAFSGLSKPLWVQGGYDFDELNDLEIQRLIDRKPDELTQEDFDGYLENYGVGSVEDLRFLLPPLLRVWEEGLHRSSSKFRAVLIGKLLKFELIDNYLNAEQRSAVQGFMLRSLADRLAKEDSLSIRGLSDSHTWIGDFNAYAVLSGRFTDLWTKIWKADCRGHAVAVLQYVASIVFDKHDNPIFERTEPKCAGGPLPIWYVDLWGSRWRWRGMNVDHLKRTLSVNYLLDRLTDIEERYSDDEVARVARVIAERIRSEPERVAARCGLLPRAFGDQASRPQLNGWSWESLRCDERGVAQISLRACKVAEMTSFYMATFDAEFRAQESGGLNCLVADLGHVQLKLVPLRDETNFDGYPLHQLGFEVPDVEDAVSTALRWGGRLESEVVRANGRLHACVRDPDGNTIELFSDGTPS